MKDRPRSSSCLSNPGICESLSGSIVLFRLNGKGFGPCDTKPGADRLWPVGDTPAGCPYLARCPRLARFPYVTVAWVLVGGIPGELLDELTEFVVGFLEAQVFIADDGCDL